MKNWWNFVILVHLFGRFLLFFPVVENCMWSSWIVLFFPIFAECACDHPVSEVGFTPRKQALQESPPYRTISSLTSHTVPAVAQLHSNFVWRMILIYQSQSINVNHSLQTQCELALWREPICTHSALIDGAPSWHVMYVFSVHAS